MSLNYRVEGARLSSLQPWARLEESTEATTSKEEAVPARRGKARG
jgi:hypothetical protein